MKGLIKGKWYQCKDAPQFCIFKFDYYERSNSTDKYFYSLAQVGATTRNPSYIGNELFFNFIDAEESLVLKYFPEEKFEVNYEIY